VTTERDFDAFGERFVHPNAAGPDPLKILEQLATEDASACVLELHLARGTLSPATRYARLRASAKLFRQAAKSVDVLADHAKPVAPPKPPRSPRGARGHHDGSQIEWSGRVGEACGLAILAARERAELDERTAARSIGLRPLWYREVEAGTRRIRVSTAERIAAVPWIGSELGAQIVEAVKSDINDRHHLTAGQVRGSFSQVTRAAITQCQRAKRW
jgi:hypothetical protein